MRKSSSPTIRRFAIALMGAAASLGPLSNATEERETIGSRYWCVLEHRRTTPGDSTTVAVREALLTPGAGNASLALDGYSARISTRNGALVLTLLPPVGPEASSVVELPAYRLETRLFERTEERVSEHHFVCERMDPSIARLK